jgi:alpha-mannosidase
MPIREIDGRGIQALVPSLDGATLNLEIAVAEGLPPNDADIEQGRGETTRILEGGQVERVQLVVHRGMVATCAFVARDVPGLGYRTYWVRPAPSAFTEAEETAVPVIENEFLRVEAAGDGTFTMTDKGTGVVFVGLNRFVDVGDRGDEYNFCPVKEDVVVSASEGKPSVCGTERSSARQTLTVSMNYRVPASLGQLRSQRSDERVDLPITTRISLIPGVRRAEIETTVVNMASDHRLRVHFFVPAHMERFQTEGHFDVIARLVDLPADTADWVEQPAPTHPQRTWTDVSDGRVGLLVANRGLPEVEVVRTDGGSEIALTLLRCVGWLSRSDLSVRRGHAGPGLPTPEAQCTDEYTFQYALVPHSGDWQKVYQEANAFSAPLRAVPTYAHSGTLPASESFVELGPESLVVSAVKEAESGRGLIIRFWNTSVEPCEGTVKLWKPPSRVARCNLGEREIGPLELDAKGAIHVPVGGREIVSLLVEYE